MDAIAGYEQLINGLAGLLSIVFELPKDVDESATQWLRLTSGSHKFFLGTDSAPHAQGEKESACGCAGCFSHHGAIELYAEVFDQACALDKLEAFASTNGPDFYGMPRNSATIVLKKQSWQIPDSLSFGDTQLIPLGAGTTLNWKLVE